MLITGNPNTLKVTILYFQLMSASNFLGGLKNFDKDTINEETVELLEVYFAADDYNLDRAKQVFIYFVYLKFKKTLFFK